MELELIRIYYLLRILPEEKHYRMDILQESLIKRLKAGSYKMRIGQLYPQKKSNIIGFLLLWPNLQNSL